MVRYEVYIRFEGSSSNPDADEDGYVLQVCVDNWEEIEAVVKVFEHQSPKEIPDIKIGDTFCNRIWKLET